MTPPSRGFLTLAAGQSQYLEMAVDMALSLREHTRLPVALVADGPMGDAAERDFAGVFDEITLLPARFLDGRARKYACAEASPFQETIFVDADCIVLGSLDYLFEGVREHNVAMLGEWHSPESEDRHHGFPVRSLLRRFHLERYLKTNSGIFAFRSPEAVASMEECLETYLREVRPRLRWDALLGRWVGDEIAFGVVGGRRGFGLLPGPGPMLWPNEIATLDLDCPARPLLHLIHAPPDSSVERLVTETSQRRLQAGLPCGGQDHLRREVRKLKRAGRATRLTRSLRLGR